MPRQSLRWVQAIRAVAVILVLAYHAAIPVAGGFMGVDMFFVVSGFIITKSLVTEWDNNASIKLRNFYVRRFLRLAPALSVLVIATVTTAFFLMSPFGPQAATFVTGLSSLLMVSNLVIPRVTGGYFGVKAEANPLLHTWSLSLEEQFYLVFPALLIFFLRLRGRSTSGRLGPVTLAFFSMGAVSFGLALLGTSGIYSRGWFNSEANFFSPLTRSWEFIAGVCVALLPRLRLASKGEVALLTICGLALAFGILLFPATAQTPGIWTLLPVLGTAGTLLVGQSNEVLLNKLIGHPILVALGDRSYSLYLWHWPFVVFAGIVWPDAQYVQLWAVLASCLPAFWSYTHVEQRFRIHRNV